MSISSQSARLTNTTSASGLLHTVFVDGVVSHCKAKSRAAQLFQEAKQGEDYVLNGSALQGAVRLTRSGGALSTPSGMLPDTSFVNPVNWQTTPVRRHKRVALDNMMEQRASGPGAYKDLVPELFDQFWEAWEYMEIRQSIGGSDGIVALVSSRTDSNTVVLKDAYGHASTTPMLFIDDGMTVAWLDSSNSYVVGGAAVIDSVSFPATINLDSASTWEPGAATPAAGDPIVFCTTNDISADYFETEYNAAPSGLKTIVDPDDILTTVFNISEDDNPRWKPWREASSVFDHIEVTEHWRKLAAKSTEPVTAQSHVALCNGAVMAELARTLEGFQQQQNLGREFEGGYTAVRIRNMDIAEDDYFWHDILMTVCVEDLYRIPLGASAGMSSEDGSEWSRLPDQDAKEAYASEYLQTFSPRRNRHGALTGISTSNVDADDFSPVPGT